MQSIAIKDKDSSGSESTAVIRLIEVLTLNLSDFCYRLKITYWRPA